VRGVLVSVVVAFVVHAVVVMSGNHGLAAEDDVGRE